MRIVWLTIFLTVLVWSGINPRDYLTWGLEVAPAVIALILLAVTYSRFRFTSLAYTLILIHAVILMVGGHYTYAEVPGFEWLNEIIGHGRNNYDKVGHFAQGFIPAIVAREILMRNSVIQGKGWLSFVVVSICLAVSALYELIEWWVALLSKEAAASFLGTQGYIWDTQSDMGWALFGAILALVVLSRVHDAQMNNLKK